MSSRFALHVATHLRFLARSRLLLGFGAVLAVMWTLYGLAFVMMESSGDKFDMLRMIGSQVRDFAWFFTAAAGLFAFWWHTSNRTTTLIFTRQGRPEMWLASVFAAAIGVAIAVHLAGFLVTLGLSIAWGIPFQAGFVWLTLDGLFESIIVVSVLTGLAAAFHPVLAIAVVIVFSEGLFYWLDLMLLGYLDGGRGSFGLRAAEWAVRGVHATLPMLNPLAEKTQEVEGTLRVAGRDWLYLAATGGYALVVFAFWFTFADYRLRRRPLR